MMTIKSPVVYSSIEQTILSNLPIIVRGSFWTKEKTGCILRMKKDGKKPLEIANALGCSLKQVRQKLRRLKKNGFLTITQN